MSQTWELLDKLRPKKRRITGRTDADGRPAKTRKHRDGARSLFDSDGNVSSLNILVPDGGPGRSTRNAVKEHERQQRLGIIPRTTIKRRDLGPRSRKSGNAEYLKFRENFIREAERELAKLLGEHEFTTNEFNCLESTQGVLDYRPNKSSGANGTGAAGISSADPSHSAAGKPWMATGPGAQKYFAQFRTVREYLESHTWVGDTEEAPDEAQRLMQKELDLRKRIKAVADRGGFSLHSQAESYQSLPGERKRIKDADDDILVQYPRLYKMKMNAAKGRVTLARKCAKAVDKYWSIQRSQSEKQAKIEARRLARLAKQTAQLVMNKWKIIERVCKAREGELAQEQLSRKAQRHLQEILEHSEQMLGARMEELSRRIMASEGRGNSTTSSPRSRSATVKIDEAQQVQPADEVTPNEAGANETAQVTETINEEMSIVDSIDKEIADENDEQAKDQAVASQENSTETTEQPSSDAKAEIVNVTNDVEMADVVNVDEKEISEDADMQMANDENDEMEKDEDSQSIDETTETEYGTDVSDVEFDGYVAVESRKEKQNTPETTMKAVDTNDGIPAKKEAAPAEKVETNEAPAGIAKQPTGTTLSTTNVNIQVPFLLRGNLREYQHVGLDWLASLYNNGLNGILADEMGLGKTIQTISLLAYLACEKGVWGPHLIVVPTSVILNWEMEFKRWLPGFKILTYYGNPKERKEKRQGWSKPNAFHVCITSYQLVLQDQQVFRRRPWHYLILDEAHHIKNFRSQRWQVLLNFNSTRRLLLTGTPLQNNLMELWSLLYFLMPNGVSASMPVGFANQKEFQEWFSHPVDRMIEGQQGMDEESRAAIQKLHTVLRPYLLRRLKADVEKQLPAKHEHIVYCRLSKRQRFLYDDFMSRAKTKDTLASGNFLSIINCLMQLRKVCNHPDLFEERPIMTSFAMEDSVQTTGQHIETLIRKRLSIPSKDATLQSLNLVITGNEDVSAAVFQSYESPDAAKLFIQEIAKHQSNLTKAGIRDINSSKYQELLRHAWQEHHDLAKYRQLRKLVRSAATAERWESMNRINSLRCARRPIYGNWLIQHCQRATIPIYQQFFPGQDDNRTYMDRSDYLRAAVLSYKDRIEKYLDIIERYGFVTPGVVTRRSADQGPLVPVNLPPTLQVQLHKALQHDIFHPIRSRLTIAFPDKRLLQYDCGKLQKLDILLRQLAAGGHRALIFTQMTRVLDVLEAFLNIHGHRYLRLDGATKVEQRQALTEQFNNDKRILAFILSTRSGGLGINLTGADTVIFYDSDWNPSMDKQCQDRTHRIGQTRDVHIYRFVTEYTIEENIFKKANQKRMLDNVVIQEGEFTNDYFHKADWWRDLPEVTGSAASVAPPVMDIEQALLEAEGDENDARAAITARNEMDMDEREFDDSQQQRQSVSVSRASSQSPVPCSGSKETPVVPPSEAADSPFEDIPAAAAEGDDIDQIAEEEEEDPTMNLTVGHVDQYMLRFWEREVVGTYLGFGGLAAPAEEYTL